MLAAAYAGEYDDCNGPSNCMVCARHDGLDANAFAACNITISTNSDGSNETRKHFFDI